MFLDSFKSPVQFNFTLNYNYTKESFFEPFCDVYFLSIIVRCDNIELTQHSSGLVLTLLYLSVHVFIPITISCCFQMNILLLVSCLVAAAAADKSPAAGSSEGGAADSYENGVGTSFTVPLNPPGLK